jgi:hypothetical protein
MKRKEIEAAERDQKGKTIAEEVQENLDAATDEIQE